jgi:hypothetical protein
MNPSELVLCMNIYLHNTKIRGNKMAEFEGMFVPTTPVFDVQSLKGKDLSSEEFLQFLVAVTQRINNISIQLNLKDIGVYPLTEIVNGQTFFPNPDLTESTELQPSPRQGLRTTVNFGQLPNAGTKSVPHGITFDDAITFVDIYGAATLPSTAGIPISFSSTVNINQNISIDVDPINVNIITAIDYSAFTRCIVVIEYIKQ